MLAHPRNAVSNARGAATLNYRMIVWVATVATCRPFGHAMAEDGTDRRGYRLALFQ